MNSYRATPFLHKVISTTIFICLSAILLCSSSLADFDICFRDIPWLSNESTVIKTLKKQGIITADMDLSDLRNDWVQSWDPFAGCEYINGIKANHSTKIVYGRVPQTNYFFGNPYALRLGQKPVCQVAGYDVSTVRVYFLPRVKVSSNGSKTYDTSDLVFVRAAYNIELEYKPSSEEAYLDLRAKLTSLYGEPVADNPRMDYNTYWHSPDGSGVYLWYSDYGSSHNVFIEYAYYNDEDMVAELDSIQRAIELAAETEKRNSIDGL